MGVLKPKDTQVQDVLGRLRSMPSEGITSLDAFNDYGITRLSSCIFVLRRAGYDIETRMVRGRDRHGKTVQYARYLLHE